jgi:cyclic-di-AMP phosphodiesterase PgpH
VLLISAHQEVEKKVGYRSTPWVLFSIVFVVGLYNLLLTKAYQSWHRTRPPYLLHLSVLIIGVLLSKLFLLFSSFPIQALPIAFVPLLLILLYPEKVAVTLTTLLYVLLVTFFAGRAFHILFFFGFGSVAAIVATPMIKKRSHIVLPSLVAGCANAVTVLFVQLDGNSLAGWIGAADKGGVDLLSGMVGMDFLPRIGWAFAGGIVSGPLALLLLPFLERMWNTVSTFGLFKYTNFDHPLMKDLLTKAPGTYQHSMTVAHLAQAASEEIGADTLLVRIGAYYHDIGKTIDPRRFVENQFGGPNPHENLSPEKSARIITNHVVNGMRLAREARLPEVILEFIR